MTIHELSYQGGSIIEGFGKEEILQYRVEVFNIVTCQKTNSI